MNNSFDLQMMQRTIELARIAASQGEVPVGAVATVGNEIVAEAWNQPIKLQDPTAHAEILALRLAAESLQNYRLPQVTLYVTLEPCAMCMGAMIHARIARLVFGTWDPKTGAVRSLFNLIDEPKLNHRIAWCSGILAQECSALLQQFFQARRGGISKTS